MLRMVRQAAAERIPHGNRASSATETPSMFTPPSLSVSPLPIHSALNTDLGRFTDAGGDMDSLCSLGVIGAEAEAE